MKPQVFYPLADRYPGPKTQRHAVKAGEFRPPRKGEWYLSGAIVEAYLAPNDLSTPHVIARIVETETVTVIRDKAFKQEYEVKKDE